MVIKWHGAPILSASGADTGDGDDIPLSSYSEVKEALPFLIRSAANGTVLLDAKKKQGSGSTEVGTKKGTYSAAFFQGESYVIETDGSNGYQPIRQTILLESRADGREGKMEVDLYLTPPGWQGYTAMQSASGASRPKAGEGGSGVIRLFDDTTKPPSSSVDLLTMPRNLGFVLSRGQLLGRPPTLTACESIQTPPSSIRIFPFLHRL